MCSNKINANDSEFKAKVIIQFGARMKKKFVFRLSNATATLIRVIKRCLLNSLCSGYNFAEYLCANMLCIFWRPELLFRLRLGKFYSLVLFFLSLYSGSQQKCHARQCTAYYERQCDSAKIESLLNTKRNAWDTRIDEFSLFAVRVLNKYWSACPQRQSKLSQTCVLIVCARMSGVHAW